MAVDIYKDVNPETLPVLSDYPDNPKHFGTALKLLVDGKQLVICHMGFRFDSYMGWCSHYCSYCYARGQNMSYDRWPLDELKVANLDEIKDHFKNALDLKRKSSNLLERCIQHRYPIRMGTQNDCFQLAEQKYRVSYKFISEIMNRYNYPYVICSKSNLVAAPEYMELYQGRDHVAFQFTLATLKQDYLDKVERGAPTAIERLATMKKLADAGHFVICRVSPHIPEYMDDLPQLVQALKDNGCKHVISELLRVSPIINEVMKSECCYDVSKLYKEMGARMGSGYIRYPLANKIKMQKELAELCKTAGITFATCADEDPSFHTVENCCGLDHMKAFIGCPMTTYDTAWKIAKEKGSIGFDELINDRWCPDTEKLRANWENGDYEGVLMNFQYDKETKRYTFVEVNPTLARINDIHQQEDKEQLELDLKTK